jgi:Domain of unknown function (DUF4349)
VSPLRRTRGQGSHGLSGRRPLVGALELVDDRFEKLGTELRAAKPTAPTALRARVASLREAEPASRRPSLRLPSRRLVLGIATAALLASFIAAGLTGLGGSETKSTTLASRDRTTMGRARGGADAAITPGAAAPVQSPAPRLGVFAASADRLQRYDASLRLRVKDVDTLSDAAKRAMNLTRSLGGYVASVQYATRGGKRGGATLVLRVPIANVQTALAELASLGTILQQRAAIVDVTRRAQTETRQLAKLERKLATAGPEEAAAIRLRLKALRAKHARLLRSARLARISLALTTPARRAAAAPSRFDRTLDDAGSVLLRELEILLYAAVVAGPLLLLGGAGIVAARAQRRRADGRLLERS